jgi:hypothetical protein
MTMKSLSRLAMATLLLSPACTDGSTAGGSPAAPDAAAIDAAVDDAAVPDAAIADAPAPACAHVPTVPSESPVAIRRRVDACNAAELAHIDECARVGWQACGGVKDGACAACLEGDRGDGGRLLDNGALTAIASEPNRGSCMESIEPGAGIAWASFEDCLFQTCTACHGDDETACLAAVNGATCAAPRAALTARRKANPALDACFERSGETEAAFVGRVVRAFCGPADR